MNKEINLGNLIIPVIKPQKGKDYYTESEKQELISIVTDNVNAGVLPQEQTRQSNEIIRQNNEQTRQAQETIRQTNETNRQTAETERESAENTRQSNESSRVSAEQTRTQTFNNKMDAVDTAIAGIHTSQNAYDQNATAKTSAFNENATSKTSDYNTNATNKTAEYNENASTKIAEYDAHIRDYEAELATKVDKVAGKGLSTNDFTNEEKEKLAELHNYDDTELSERVDDIEQEQTTQNTNISTNATNIESLQEENESLKKIVSQLPQVTGQGTEIALENTIEAPFTIFDVEGNSVQDGTPSPDNEVPIYSAGDNENLFDKDNEEQFLQNLTPDNNGLIVSAQTSTTSANYIRTIIIPCKSDANYAITRFLGGKTFFIYESDEYPTLNKQTTLLKRNDDAGKVSEIIKTSATAKYLLVKIYNTYASEYYSYDELISSIKIEKGNKASGYSPYGMGSINEKIKNADGTEEQDYSIFVQQPMRSIGDVRDCFVKKDGNWYERHWIKEFIVSQNTSINLQSINDYGIANFYMIFQNNYYDLTSKDNQLCNLFSKQTSSIATTETEGFLPTMNLASGLIGVYIRILSSRAKTVEEFKQWANTNNLKNYYILAEPLDLPCTETQIQQLENSPSTYKEMTIIQSEDETPAYLEVSGIYDLNKLIQRTEVLESEV